MGSKLIVSFKSKGRFTGLDVPKQIQITRVVCIGLVKCAGGLSNRRHPALPFALPKPARQSTDVEASEALESIHIFYQCVSPGAPQHPDHTACEGIT